MKSTRLETVPDVGNAAAATPPSKNVHSIRRTVLSANKMRRKRHNEDSGRSVTLRLSGETRELFERLEVELGVYAMDVFRDGLWIGLQASERWHCRRPGFQLNMSRPDFAKPVDILARGSLNCVERFARMDVTPDVRSPLISLVSTGQTTSTTAML